MRLALVANAKAGTETDAEAVAADLRARGATVEVLPVERAEAAADAAPDRIVVAGGDGSVGVAARVAARSGTPLAVVPAGTANDFARALKLPQTHDDAIALAADAGAATRDVELALAGDRPFVNVASAGLSVVAAERAAPLKPRLGALAYAVGAARAALVAHPLPARVRVDGTPLFAGRAWQVIVAASGAFGGGSSLEAAEPDDDLLDVAIIEARSRLALLRRAKGMRLGGLTAQPGVVHGRGREVEVALADGTPWNVDGEVCRLDEPARFTLARTRVTVVVPR
jgi:diacylglycerol kinase family enzyme